MLRLFNLAHYAREGAEKKKDLDAVAGTVVSQSCRLPTTIFCCGLKNKYSTTSVMGGLLPNLAWRNCETRDATSFRFSRFFQLKFYSDCERRGADRLRLRNGVEFYCGLRFRLYTCTAGKTVKRTECIKRGRCRMRRLISMTCF